MGTTNKQLTQQYVNSLEKPVVSLKVLYDGYSKVVEKGFTRNYRCFVKLVRRIILHKQIRAVRDQVRHSKKNLAHQ
jgi:hypothetical protein